jgi:hypothetical protein
MIKLCSYYPLVRVLVLDRRLLSARTQQHLLRLQLIRLQADLQVLAVHWERGQIHVLK